MKTCPYPLSAAVAALLLLSSLLITTPAAHAAFLYEYEVSQPSGQNRAGNIVSIYTSYNELTSEFSWSYTTEARQGEFNDGFWLVISGGPNPKRREQKYAILYGDLEANRLTAYEYDADARFNSFDTPGNFLASWDGVLAVQISDTQVVSFSLDVSGLNQAIETDEWEGTQFDDKLGIWFHTSIDTNFSYDPVTGELLSYDYFDDSYHDAIRQLTVATAIPLPASAWLFGFAVSTLLTGVKRPRRH